MNGNSSILGCWSAVSRLIEAMYTPTLNIIETGLARSVGEPRGRRGLEGDILDQSYRFERGEDGRGRYCHFFQM